MVPVAKMWVPGTLPRGITHLYSQFPCWGDDEDSGDSDSAWPEQQTLQNWQEESSRLTWQDERYTSVKCPYKLCETIRAFCILFNA